MAVSVPHSEFHAAPAARGVSAISLLADRVNRTIVAGFGDARDASMTTAAITEHSPLDATPRLIRDRLRELQRAGVLGSTESAAPGTGATTRWSLTAAGEDLRRLQALIARIATHGAGLGPTTPSVVREHVVEESLAALSDPVVLQLLRCLAEHGPVDPVHLEACCQPTPRRTLYRRIGPLVSAGVVVRTTSRSVPRSTHYELKPRWRPAGAILLLSGWWEARHSEPVGTISGFDLPGLIFTVLPLVRVAAVQDGARLWWTVDDEPKSVSILLTVDGDRLRLAVETAPSGAADAGDTQVSATPAQWSSALVTDRRDELVTDGDEHLASEVLTAVRKALLSYVR